MKKNDVFTITFNGDEVVAVVLYVLKYTPGYLDNTYVCYGHNKIFLYVEEHDVGWHTKWIDVVSYGVQEILVDYAILPDYDAMLERYNDIEVAQAETANGM